jgi:hypothetical protein
MPIKSNLHTVKQPIAVVSSDNSHYREFSSVCQEAWERIGFGFYHAEVGSSDFPALPGIPPSLQGQLLRLFAASTLGDRVVLLSDIDMLPLSANYFLKRLPREPNDISIYSSHAYRRGRYPVCYISAFSSTFGNLLLDNPSETWSSFAKRLYAMGFGWNTDELYLTGRISNSTHNISEFKRLWIKGVAPRRIDRAVFWSTLVPYPLDFHCPRPFSNHKSFILDQLKRIW